MRLFRVSHSDQVGGMPRRLGRLGDHGADELAAKGDLVGLQHPQLLVLVGAQPGCAQMGEDVDHACQHLRRRDVDRRDPAAGNGGLQGREIGRPLDRLIEGIGRGAHHLGGSIEPLQRRSDRMGMQQLSHGPGPPPDRAAARRAHSEPWGS